MKERPILFSAPMVSAILGGKKTQTRRALRDDTWLDPKLGAIRMCNVAMGVTGFQEVDCPYGQPGDRLWVREAFRFLAVHDHVPPREISSGPLWYEAQDEVPFHPSEFGKLRPSMFMPRWASRITLEITEVRVERLQDISEADSISEGAAGHPDGPWHAYRSLWTLINGPDSWEANPWVWVVSFND